ncbi:hypothetical protein J6590_078155 [Homalodisca vitripennis]|nr:hypothetical protein J6590_078155 [Homalodisca vitripennis]
MEGVVRIIRLLTRLPCRQSYLEFTQREMNPDVIIAQDESPEYNTCAQKVKLQSHKTNVGTSCGLASSYEAMRLEAGSREEERVK